MNFVGRVQLAGISPTSPPPTLSFLPAAEEASIVFFSSCVFYHDVGFHSERALLFTSLIP